MKAGWRSADWLVPFTRTLIPVCLLAAIIWQAGISLWPHIRAVAPVSLAIIVFLVLAIQLVEVGVRFWRRSSRQDGRFQQALPSGGLFMQAGVVFSLLLLILALALTLSLVLPQPRLLPG